MTTPTPTFTFDGPQGRISASETEIRDLIASGQITSGTFLLKGDSNEWKAARELFPAAFTAEIAKEKSANPPVNPATMIYAGFWARLGALTIDSLILVIPLTAISVGVGVIAGITEGLGLIIAIPVWIGVAIIALALAPYFHVSSHQATPGMRVLGIKIRTEGGGRLSIPQAIFRQLGRAVSALPLYLGYFWSVGDEKKRTWHDRMVGSVVVVE